MTLPIHLLPRARADLQDIDDMIRPDQPAAADRFLDAVDSAFKTLAHWPGVGRSVEDQRVPGLRVGKIVGFPNYLIYYRVTAERVDVLRVVHGARDQDGVIDRL